jgi:hypothetical protein
VPGTCNRRLGAPVVTLLLSLVAAGSTLAQTVTPAAYPAAPDPSECVVAPTSIEEVEGILATPVAEPAGAATPFVAPEGVPTDAKTTAEVAATLHQVLACANAGDPLRVASLYTDNFLRDFFGGVPRDDLLAFLTTPARPLPEDQKRIIVRIGEVRLLPDGRAGVMIVLDEPGDLRAEEPDFAILERVADQWLVDEIHEDGGTGAT